MEEGLLVEVGGGAVWGLVVEGFEARGECEHGVAYS